MKKTLIILIVIVLIALGGGYVWHTQQKPHTPPATTTVKRGDIALQATAIGSIVPQHSITVKSQLSGIVERVFQNAGDYVHKNQPLLQIKPDPTPQQVAQAIETLRETQAAVHADAQQVDNFKYMLKHKVIEKNYQNYVTAQQKLQADRAKLTYAQQSLALMEQGSATIDGHRMHSMVTSPVTGFILTRNVDVGDPVIALGDNQAATALFTIANMHDLIFKGSVDEIDAGKLKTGMHADITIGALPKTVVTGTLTKLALQSENQNNSQQPATGSNNTATNNPFNVGFEVEISHLKIPQHSKLRSGYSATAKILIKKAHHVLLIPERAIIFKQGKSYVRLPAAHKDKKPHLQAVKLGISDGMNTQVLAGLHAGQAVLLP